MAAALRRGFGLACAMAGLAALAALASPRARAADCPPPLPPLSAAQQQVAARTAPDRGFLWTLQRDGHTSYLYGTLHVGKPAWTLPGPKVAAALAASDMLALEIDPADPALSAPAADDAASAPPLPAALQARLARRIAAACLPARAFDAMDPALQVVALGVLEARWVGLDPAYAQEPALAALERAAGRPVRALESVAMQRELLAPAAPGAARAEVEAGLAELEGSQGRATIARLAQAWNHGDLATLASYAKWCDCIHDAADRAQMRALNDARNPALADGIAALHARGQRVFAAVGALHMTGPQGLPRLLAARGFRVTRVAFGARAPGAQ